MSYVKHRYVNQNERLEDIEKIQGQLVWVNTGEIYLDISSEDRLFMGTANIKKIAYEDNQTVYQKLQELSTAEGIIYEGTQTVKDKIDYISLADNIQYKVSDTETVSLQDIITKILTEYNQANNIEYKVDENTTISVQKAIDNISTADGINYDNAISGLKAENVQAAIDELLNGGINVTNLKYSPIDNSKLKDAFVSTVEQALNVLNKYEYNIFSVADESSKNIPFITLPAGKRETLSFVQGDNIKFELIDKDTDTPKVKISTKNIPDLSNYIYITKLDTDSDLNNVSTYNFGIYACNTVNTILNKPEGVSTFNMISCNNLQQLYGNGKIYTRYSTVDPTGEIEIWSNWAEIGSGGGNANTDIIAEDFNPEKTYEIGDYVIKDNKLYKMIDDEPGKAEVVYTNEDFEFSSSSIIPKIQPIPVTNDTTSISIVLDGFEWNGFNIISATDVQYRLSGRSPFILDKDNSTWAFDGLKANGGINSFTGTFGYMDNFKITVTVEGGGVPDPWVETNWENVRVMDEIESGGGTGGLSSAITSISDGTHTINAKGKTQIKFTGDGNTTVNVNEDNNTITISSTGGGGDPYELPIASNTVLGGIKVGQRLSIDGNGVLNAADQSITVVNEVKKGNMEAVSSNAVATAIEGIPTPTTAADLEYDNSTTAIEATDVQSALDYAIQHGGGTPADVDIDFNETSNNAIANSTVTKQFKKSFYDSENSSTISDVNIIGNSSINYSTEEHVVGTWIDGSDVYEKTYYNPKTSLLEPNFGVNKKIIKVEGFYLASNTNIVSIPSPWSCVYVNGSNKGLYLDSNDGAMVYDSEKTYVTIRYVYKKE